MDDRLADILDTINLFFYAVFLLELVIKLIGIGIS
jgi:hypothetical protein